MRRPVLRLLGFLAILSLAPQAACATEAITGNWINPRGSIIVTTGPCGRALCGRVSWANDEALADAGAAGVAQLVGTQLLQDYRPAGAERWSGRVYVPDMGRTFSSTIQQLDANRLKISGCLIGGWFCKSQIWQRHG
jgi:uncharacterized protein (DUF2147 family)